MHDFKIKIYLLTNPKLSFETNIALFNIISPTFDHIYTKSQPPFVRDTIPPTKTVPSLPPVLTENMFHNGSNPKNIMVPSFTPVLTENMCHNGSTLKNIIVPSVPPVLTENMCHNSSTPKTIMVTCSLKTCITMAVLWEPL